MSNNICSSPVTPENARDAWKKSTSEMITLICNSRRPSDFKNCNNDLLEGRDFKDQNKVAIAVLDSIISEKNVIENRPISKDLKAAREINNIEEIKENKPAIKNVRPSDKSVQELKDSKCTQVDFIEKEECSSVGKHVCKHQNCTSNQNFKKLQMKFNEHISFNQQEVSQISKDERKKVLNNHKTPNSDFDQCRCKCLKQPPNHFNAVVDKQFTTDVQILKQECFKLNKELELVRDSNKDLQNELTSKISENDQLRDQIYSLELSLKTLTEAINLQDEQLSEYGSIVTTLKNSRSVIIDKMKDANEKNSCNIMIMENIEKQVEQLKCQLDAYNELLSNQSAEHTDKASSTESDFIDETSFDEIIKKKDCYITLLQDRLCEAIVDLKNKDREINNHTSSVKSLINNYEGERKCLEERLKVADTSMEKFEEHKIKQQETMKQLMKLIEFLQNKLEVHKN